MNEPKEIVNQEVESMSDALEIIQSRNILFDRIMSVAIKATNPSDWIDQNGKPYLQGSGAEKVARRFGVKIFDTVAEREDLEDEKGKYYLYTVTGKAAFSDRDSIEAFGTCSSRDQFFAKRKDNNGESFFLPSSEIDMGNIKKSAYTNFLGNAITRLLGIRNLSWADLDKHGITREGKTSIAYDKGASKAAATKKSTNAEKDTKKPYWTSEYNGKIYIYARTGKHFSEEFLRNLGLSKSQKKEGLYYSVSTPDFENALIDEFTAAEETLAIQKEGGDNATTA